MVEHWSCKPGVESSILSGGRFFLFFCFNIIDFGTGKTFSEALILPSTNPQYDDRLFIELRVQYMKIPSSEHAVYTNWFFF